MDGVPGPAGAKAQWGGEGGRSQVHRLLLACEQAVGGSRHRLDVDLGAERRRQLEAASSHSDPAHPHPTTPTPPPRSAPQCGPP